MLARRMERVKSSPTLALSAKAKTMAATGIDVVDFSVGEPDFDTPSFIKQAAIRAINEDFTHYTMANGIPEPTSLLLLAGGGLATLWRRRARS